MAFTSDRPEQTGGVLSRPEVELLLCCAQSPAGEVGIDRTARIRQLLGGEIDWNYLLTIAHRHALAPLLYWQLNRTAADQLPPRYAAQLRASFTHNAARNMMLTQELRQLVKLFDDEGILAIPYKGPTLAACAYRNPALRCYTDLDIMVSKRDVPRARDLLAAAGYSLQPLLTEAQQTILLRTQHNLPFVHAERMTMVELHWEVAGKQFAAPLGVEHAQSRLVLVQIGNGVPLMTLAPEDLLLSLCVHGSKHLWERLSWLCDIAGLIESHSHMDWNSVVERAAREGSERMLFLGLKLAAELLKTELPEDVRLKVEAEPVVALLGTQLSKRFFEPGRMSPGVLETFIFQLRARRRVRDKLRYFSFAFSPTDADLVALRLPTPLGFLYYAFRPFRLAFETAPKLSGRARAAGAKGHHLQ